MYLVKIKRETSKYNKYMLWNIEGQAEETQAKFSDYTKTLKEARDKYNKKGYKVIEINTRKTVFKNPSYN